MHDNIWQTFICINYHFFYPTLFQYKCLILSNNYLSIQHSKICSFHKKAAGTYTVMHTFVNQKLDYANTLLYGLPMFVIYNYFLNVQNFAACHWQVYIIGNSTSPQFFMTWHCLPIRCWVEFEVHTMYNGFTPGFLSYLVEPYKLSQYYSLSLCFH